ncbi:hypothetical protein JIQ42_06688 [Leishmania sp. Namibia]|uniref:hypothetical protein n=1 Tax=Leishmania sp. Namibia TaxID=2802991 RepID=UPI001B608B59|nr:hypothetical protein JIQ42_06688 [Leishmania sp. Namibia]
MPSYSSRSSSQQRLPPAVCSFTHEDVNAFRLQPLSSVSAAAASASKAAASTSPLPNLQASAREKATARFFSKTESEQHTRRAAQPATSVASQSGVGAIRVPPVAAPRVYASLMPTRLQPNEGGSSGKSDASQQTASSSPRLGGRASAAGGTNLWPHEAPAALPVAATEYIVAPSLSAAESRQLALWTRSTSVFTTPTTPAHVPTPPFNDALHRWWRERQTIRLHERHVAALAEQLSPTLEQAVRGLLTAEERHWQLEVQRQQQRNSGARSAPATGSPVPLHKMAALLQAVQVVLHQTSVSFIEVENNEVAAAKHAGGENRDAGGHGGLASTSSRSTEEDDDEVEAQQALSRAQRREVLEAALHTERALAEEVKKPASAALSAGAGISIVTLPYDRPVPAPVLRLEAAVSAVLLSNLIEKAELSTPGMAFAGHLLRQYILPHMYADFAGWIAVRPRLGTLSEQVTHLAALPLRLQQQHYLTDAAAQAQADVDYLEGVVKSWTMRAWLRRVTQERQYLAQQATTERIVARLHSRIQLQRVFNAWWREAQHGRHLLREAQMEEAYIQFLSESKLSAQRDSRAYVGTAATMAAALLMCDPHPSPTHTAALWPRDHHQQQQQQEEEGGRGRRYSTPSSREGSSATGILASAASTVTGTGSGWTPVPSCSRGTSTQAPLPLPSSRARYDARAAKRKGAGHSRIHLSFMRRKARSQASANQRQLRGAGAAGADGLHGGSDDASKDVSGEGGMMERYVVCQVDSEEQHEGTSDEDGAVGGGGTLTQPVYLESHADDIDEEGNSPYHAHAHASPTYTTPDGNASSARNTATHGAGVVEVPGSPLFLSMLTKLRELDQVNAYLRAELAVQARRLRKVEAANNGLRERNEQLEDATLQLLREKLEALNITQEQLMTINEKNRRLRHFRSRLRAHRHRPWQNTVLRVVGDICGVSTAAAEDADEARVRADRYGTHGSSGDDNDGSEGESSNAPSQATKAAVPADAPAGGKGVTATMPVAVRSMRCRANLSGSESDEMRLFSRIAPIVLHSARQLPDAFLIISDWANSCLDDLESLDDMKDGPLAERFCSFGEEARSGVLISRLLYYLALPRYRTTTSAAEVERGGGAVSGMGTPTGARLDGFDRRRQLLELHGVQLNPPFPVYTDCFGDLLSMPPGERMCHLLAFATELMAGQDVAAQQQDEKGRTYTINGANNSGQASFVAGLEVGEAGDGKRGTRVAAAPPPALSAPLPLHTVVDPYAIVRGEKSAVITLIALLYVRFAHPFNHKSRECAKQERSALLHLWSGGQATTAELNGTASDDVQGAARGGGNSGEVGSALARAPPPGYSIEDDMLRQLPTEDKTAWQLFRERCLPAFGTQAHPFLLRGGFWPSVAFESPELAAMLSSLATALRRSLELHRWHVTLNCLVPVRTYGGLSRGVFTGPCASASALLLGLHQDGRESLLIERPLIRQCVEERQRAFLAALASGPLGVSAAPMDDGGAKPATQQPQLADLATETESLATSITGVWQEDILSLFVQRATLSAHLALPVLDLGSWRMLCSDIGLVSMASPDMECLNAHGAAALRGRELSSPQMPTQPLAPCPPRLLFQEMDLEVVTGVFQRAVMGVSFARDEVDPAVLQPARTSRDASSQMAPASAGEHSKAEGGRSQSPPSLIQQKTLTDIQMDMTYASFVVALVLLAHRLYPACTSGTQASAEAHMSSSRGALGSRGEHSDSLERGDNEQLGLAASLPLDDVRTGRSRPAPSGRPAYCSLLEAFRLMMQNVVLPSSTARLQAADPRFTLHQLTRGVGTQAVLQNCAPALLLVYQAYSKEIWGEPGMVRKDLLRLLRDAMLTSTELSQYLIYDLFSRCSVVRQANEEVAIANRKEIDRLAHAKSRVSLPRRRSGYRAVRIVDASVGTDSAAAYTAQRKRANILTFEGFCDLLCVLCGFKQPNVFVPFEERLLAFLHHSLLRPLVHTVPNLAPLLSRAQPTGASNSVLVSSGSISPSSFNNDGIITSVGGRSSSG